MYRPGKSVPTSATTANVNPFLREGTALPFPTEMIVDATGEPFTGLIVGDWPEHSPSVLGCSPNGKLGIGSFEELTVTDARVLPNDTGYAIRARRQKTSAPATPRSRSRSRSRTPTSTPAK